VILGVIFDLDGVLVSTDEYHYRSWQRLADEEGIYFDREINHRLRGVSRMVSLEIVLERSQRTYTPDEKSALADRKNSYYRDSLRKLTRADLLPGVLATLVALRGRGVRIAVGSSSKNTRLILDRIGLTDQMDAVVDGNDITESKPDPKVFLVAAEHLGLKPAECLVVEDATAGIEAARRAGMAVFGIGSPSNLPGVAPLAASLADVTVEELLSPAC
jgi:beta-phosphoglucomutase